MNKNNTIEKGLYTLFDNYTSEEYEIHTAELSIVNNKE